MLIPLLLAFGAAAPSSNARAPEAVKVIVLSTRIDRASEKDLAGTVTELVLAAVAKGRGVQAVGEADVVPFLDEAARKQLDSCDDDAACLVEIGGALGADYLVSVSLGAIGRNYLLAARLLDSRKGVVAERASRSLGRDEDALAEAVCPLLLDMFAKLGRRDPRVGGDVAACTAAPAPAPVAAAAAPPATPAPVANADLAADLPPPPAPDPDLEKPVRIPAPSGGLTVGGAVRAGIGPHVGISGVGAELRLGRVGLEVGTGLYAFTGGLSVNLLSNTDGPYLAGHFVVGSPGVLGRALRHDGGVGYGAVAGWELRPVPWLSVRAGLGVAFTDFAWGDDSRGREYESGPLVYELAIGPAF